jgi:4,5-dihydroxyphthalate decarboxylase
MAPRMPRPFAQGSASVRRLFPDYRTIEEEYFRRTQIFPIMHFVVIREDVYRANRWLRRALYKRFLPSEGRGAPLPLRAKRARLLAPLAGVRGGA